MKISEQLRQKKQSVRTADLTLEQYYEITNKKIQPMATAALRALDGVKHQTDKLMESVSGVAQAGFDLNKGYFIMHDILKGLADGKLVDMEDDKVYKKYYDPKRYVK